MSDAKVLMGKGVCTSDICESSVFLTTFEEGEEYVRCPLCNNLVKVPTETRSFPTGRHDSLGCGRPWDDHQGPYCPSELRRNWQ